MWGKWIRRWVLFLPERDKEAERIEADIQAKFSQIDDTITRVTGEIDDANITLLPPPRPDNGSV